MTTFGYDFFMEEDLERYSKRLLVHVEVWSRVVERGCSGYGRV